MTAVRLPLLDRTARRPIALRLLVRLLARRPDAALRAPRPAERNPFC